MASSLSQDDEIISGINVTPLVDVVLVLLIIFLITAPVIYQSAIKVQLPSAKSGEQSKTNQLHFVIKSNGEIYFNQKMIQISELALQLKSGTIKKEETAYISADKTTPHGSVIQVMDVLRDNGILKLSLTVESK